MWVRPGANVADSSGPVLINMERKYAIISSNGNWAYYVAGGSGSSWEFQETGTQIATNRWVQIALVCTSTNTLFYVDGKLVHTRGSRTNSGAATSVDDGAIGGWTGNTIEPQSFDGQVDEIKIWQENRSAAISSDLHPRQAPTAGNDVYWDFIEGTGTTVHDRVGNYDLTATAVVFSGAKQVTSA